ncbi:MAG: hypothetical protein HYW02_04275, partial [Deltaproteobacteria bacterium]|nr:hypothetical protein [Deltaproteobacteria bacterium]
SSSSTDLIDDIDESSDDASEEEQPGVVPPTAGPVEIPGPSAFRFPTRVTIDISSLTGEANRSQSLVVQNRSKSVCTGGVCSLITMGTDLVDLLQEIGDKVFSSDGMFSCIAVESSATQTSYDGKVCSADDTYGGWDLHIDFGTFSSSRTETSQCSGSTVSLPICFRVWIRSDSSSSWQRFMAGFLNTAPGDTTGEGAGAFWLHPSDFFPSDSLPGIDMQFKWNHEDLTDRGTEIAYGYHVGQSDGEKGRVLVADEELSSLCFSKLVKVRKYRESFLFGGASDLKTVGLWDECQPYWSGQLVHDNIGGPIDWQDRSICAYRLTGERINYGICTNAGINSGSENFIDLPETAEFTYPSTTLLIPQQLFSL